MFNPDFYPTPKHIIALMLEDIKISEKRFCEPQAGKADIINYLNECNALQVLFCEINEDLQKICQDKAKFLKADFLQVTAEEISHIDVIVMNPPFSADEKHILHAFEIAPAGCKIISLCNAQTVVNEYSRSRRELKQIINLYGSFENLGSCFKDSDRPTDVEVGLIRLQKAGGGYEAEFDGFYLDEEETAENKNGIIPYDFIRDLVNRYTESVKIFDRQMDEAVNMNKLLEGFFSVKIGLNITDDKKPIERAEFKKEMQKSAWNFIFAKLNMQKYATSKLREDINKFIETQVHVPFTMKNIYKMLQHIVQTNSERMDLAIEVVFDDVTKHHFENRFGVQGWKTNENYVLSKRFIIPNVCKQDQRWYKGESQLRLEYRSEILDDMLKAICYITGDNYGKYPSLYSMREPHHLFVNDIYQTNDTSLDVLLQKKQILELEGKKVHIMSHSAEYGKWFDWAFFRVKCFKVGTAHFEFKDPDVWAKFNQRISKIKGHPLFEKAPDKRTAKQKAKAEKSQ